MTCPFLLAALLISSPEVHPDRRVTFRLSAPKAAEVKLWGEWISKYNTLEPMQKSADGTWSAVVGPLAPNLYSYIFLVDGVVVPDSNNPDAHLDRDGFAGSLVEVPGSAPKPYQPRPTASHGVLHRHTYRSTTGLGLRRVIVYTPPGYNPSSRKKYPVLYFLHGSGDTERAWSDTGRAHVIADNLIAEGQLDSLIMVMPNCHTEEPNHREKFERDLRQDLIPFVESQYRTINSRSARAIAGLSKGAFQALWYGLDHPEFFGGIGVFSGGVVDAAGELQVAGFAGKKLAANPFRISIGDRDMNLPFARRLDQVLTKHGIGHEFIIAAESGHTWPFWRQALADFLPKLFNPLR